MKRFYYSAEFKDFLVTPIEQIVGELALASPFADEQAQKVAWHAEITLLKESLAGYRGTLFLEYAIPRMGRRIDAVALIGCVIFVLEFKVGGTTFDRSAIDQVCDYALDLNYFHETSHDQTISPILVATEAEPQAIATAANALGDSVLYPMCVNGSQISEAINEALRLSHSGQIDSQLWEAGRYSPTPTIVEAASALYAGHGVGEISRSDASAKNLSLTADAISQIIDHSFSNSQKSICFVTGVPGAGKTLVGLNLATKHNDIESKLYSVFLSGNGPLVDVLREALVRDKVDRARDVGQKLRKGAVLSEVKRFIQNVHHFRDACIQDPKPPIEHVAIFDEAQRAWNQHQTANFMRRKKGIADFSSSEPSYLISCMDRHTDWAVIVCLVGGGQEINTGEAGIAEWLTAISTTFPHWRVYISPRLADSEFTVDPRLVDGVLRDRVSLMPQLHLSVSMRSFRAENLSLMIRQVLDLEREAAKESLRQLKDQYPMVLTRDLSTAKRWLRKHARGSERYGIVVSSQAERLKPEAIHVKAPMSTIHWFLGDKEDVRSSYHLEDVATEFHIQGLELDWVCVTWDADFRFDHGWHNWSFKGSRWQRIRQEQLQRYQKNAYRVLLTRARQGMVIVVPKGDPTDPTRPPEYYDPVFDYLESIGFEVI